MLCWTRQHRASQCCVGHVNIEPVSQCCVGHVNTEPVSVVLDTCNIEPVSAVLDTCNIEPVSAVLDTCNIEPVSAVLDTCNLEPVSQCCVLHTCSIEPVSQCCVGHVQHRTNRLFLLFVSLLLFVGTLLSLAGNSDGLSRVSETQQHQVQRYPFLSAYRMFLYPGVFGILYLHAYACDRTRGLYGHRKRVCTGR